MVRNTDCVKRYLLPIGKSIAILRLNWHLAGEIEGVGTRVKTDLAEGPVAASSLPNSFFRFSYSQAPGKGC